LPVRDGGLRIRRVAALAIPAFIASAASTLSLQDDLLSDCGKSDNDLFQTYLSIWSEKIREGPDTLPAKQPFWDRPGVPEDKTRVQATLSSAHHRASFLVPPHSTVEIGCSPFLLPHVALSLMMRQ